MNTLCLKKDMEYFSTKGLIVLFTVSFKDNIVLEMVEWKVWSNGGMLLMQENEHTWRRVCPHATFSTTNPTWIGLGLNPGLHSERLVTNHLSHDTVQIQYL